MFTPISGKTVEVLHNRQKQTKIYRNNNYIAPNCRVALPYSLFYLVSILNVQVNAKNISGISAVKNALYVVNNCKTNENSTRV